jgi:hypothetical protein
MPVVGRSWLVNYFKEVKPIPYDVIEKNLSIISQWMKDPKQSAKLAAKLKERGVETKGRLNDLKQRKWLTAVRDPKFFKLLKDPKLFADDAKAVDSKKIAPDH